MPKLKPSQVNMQTQDLDSAFEQFIRSRKLRGRVTETTDTYRKSYNRFIDYFGEVETDDITASMLDDWIISMRDEKLSTATINTHLRSMRAFFYWCMADERQYIKPRFKVELIKEDSKEPKAYEPWEVQALLKKPDKTEKKQSMWCSWAMSCFVIGTGARIGTMAEIRMKDIDLKGGTVYYQHMKTRNTQHANMPPKLIRALEDYIAMWRYDAEPDDYLFCNTDGDKASKSTLKASYARYAKSRGVTKTSIHGLRHTFAREWIKSGGDIVLLQQLLGHSNIAMSAHYADIYATMEKDRFIAHNPLENMTRGGARRTLKPKQ